MIAYLITYRWCCRGGTRRVLLVEFSTVSTIIPTFFSVIFATITFPVPDKEMRRTHVTVGVLLVEFSTVSTIIPALLCVVDKTITLAIPNNIWEIYIAIRVLLIKLDAISSIVPTFFSVGYICITLSISKFLNVGVRTIGILGGNCFCLCRVESTNHYINICYFFLTIVKCTLLTAGAFPNEPKEMIAIENFMLPAANVM